MTLHVLKNDYRCLRLFAGCSIFAGLLAWLPVLHAEAPQRCVELTADVTLNEISPKADVHVWIPVPQRSAWQDVRQVVQWEDLPLDLTQEQRFGNKMLHGAGRIDSNSAKFEIVWQVRRREEAKVGAESNAELQAAERALWLRSTAKVPVGGAPLTLLQGISLPVDARARIRVIYDRVLQHMSYDKSRPGYGTGDAVWACDSRFGNCTDFHSLFMSLARSQSIPTQFEIGYPLPTGKKAGQLTGYHCWAWFHQSGLGWQPVDISEADKHPELTDYYFGHLSSDRVAFSVGRDIQLAPAQRGKPLNYFVVPYAEVDGVAIESSQLDFTLSFRDR